MIPTSFYIQISGHLVQVLDRVGRTNQMTTLIGVVDHLVRKAGVEPAKHFILSEVGIPEFPSLAEFM